MAGNKTWSGEELEILQKNYQTSTIEEMQELLDRSKNAIEKKASDLGLLIRNGKQIKANRKIIINVTESHFQFLKKHRNQSRIIREALNSYINERNSENT